MSRRPRSTPRPASSPSPAPAPLPARAGWVERVRPWHVAMALAGLHVLLAALSLDPTPHTGGDNAAYVALARSLLERGTYQELWDPAQRAHTQYPPGWPALLAVAMTLGLKSWVQFKRISIAFAGAAVALSYLWARRVSTPGVALAVGALLAVGPGVLVLAPLELSDVPFWAMCMLALWAFARVPHPVAASMDAPGSASVGGGDASGRVMRAVALACVATLLAYGTRSAGLPLVVAAAAWLAWERRWRHLALFTAIVAPFALAWHARGQLVGTQAYVGQIWFVDPYRPALGTVGVGGMLARVVRNTGDYVNEHVPSLLVGGRDSTMATLVGVAVFGLAAAGWSLRLRRPGAAEVWLPLYLGLVLIWPAEWAADRFLLPILPVLLLCAAETVSVAARATGRPVYAGAFVVLLVAGMGLGPMRSELGRAAACRAAYGPENRYPCVPVEWFDFFSMADWVRASLPPGGNALTRKPTLWWAFAGQPGRVYPFSPEPDSLVRAAGEAGARYVLLDHLDNIGKLYLAPAIVRRPAAFCMIRSLGEERATLMGLHPDAARVPDERAQAPTEAVTLQFQDCPPPNPSAGSVPPPSP